VSIFDTVYRFTSLYEKEKQAMCEIRAFAEYAVERAMQDKSSPIARLQAAQSHESNKDLIDEVITLMFAGQDTSAVGKCVHRIRSLNERIQ
jgi:cytochrome P450